MTIQQQNPIKITTPGMYCAMFKGYPDIMNVQQVGEILGVSMKTVYKLIRAGSLTTLKVGREFRIPKVHLLEYITMAESR